jgi:hypothetical protein
VCREKEEGLIWTQWGAISGHGVEQRSRKPEFEGEVTHRPKLLEVTQDKKLILDFWFGIEDLIKMS